jgi:hypothetical protein
MTMSDQNLFELLVFKMNNGLAKPQVQLEMIGFVNCTYPVLTCVWKVGITGTKFPLKSLVKQEEKHVILRI